jgi:lipoprotein-anchoring transpeptidase ErfK/SrfK
MAAAVARTAATAPAARGGGGASAGVTAASWPMEVNATNKVAKQLRINIAWQVALEASDFSPGIIDGAFGKKGTMALTEYAARNFPGVDKFDKSVYDTLNVDVAGAVVMYTVTEDDAAQVGGPLPEDWNAKARLSRLNYESFTDCLAEKFHCTQGLLAKLNPGMKLDKLAVGSQLVVPNVRPFPTDYVLKVEKRVGAASVMVNLGEKTIRVFGPAGEQLALFHCSVAKDKNKLPDRDTKVQLIASPNPQYTFNPSMWPEVHNVTQVLQIPPGPRNPVGLSWVQLDLPGYGIHGVPKPELIGKTGSHGCFRLTNWDALKFAGWVRVGMAVKVVNPDKNPE